MQIQSKATAPSMTAPALGGAEFRRARLLLEMPQYVAAGILGLTPKQLNEIELQDLAMPAAVGEAVSTLLSYAERVRTDLPRLVPDGSHSKLPFPRPSCPHCEVPVRSHHSSQVSKVRGSYFRLWCPLCSRRFWSSDGTLHPIARSNRREFADRVRCPDCDVDCTAITSPGKRIGQHYWKCPKCKERYRNENGRAVKTQRSGHVKPLPFLADRKCPKCRSGELYIKGRPESAGFWYFRCNTCEQGFRWNEKLKKLVAMKRRAGYTRKRKPGPRPGMTEARKTSAKKLLQLQAEYGGGRKSFERAVRVVFPKDDFHSAYQRAAKMVGDYRRERKKLGRN